MQSSGPGATSTLWSVDVLVFATGMAKGDKAERRRVCTSCQPQMQGKRHGKSFLSDFAFRIPPPLGYQRSNGDIRLRKDPLARWLYLGQDGKQPSLICCSIKSNATSRGSHMYVLVHGADLYATSLEEWPSTRLPYFYIPLRNSRR